MLFYAFVPRAGTARAGPGLVYVAPSAQIPVFPFPALCVCFARIQFAKIGEIRFKYFYPCAFVCIRG